MGIETAIILGAASVASTTGQVISQFNERDTSLAALDLKNKQNELFYEQKRLKSYTDLNSFVAKQKAASTVTGFSMRSPTFQNIGLGTLQKGGEELRNISTEQEIARRNIEIEKKNVRQKLVGQLFADVGGLVESGTGIFGSMPKGKGSVG